MWRLHVASQTAQGYEAESGQVVSNLLLVCVLTSLHTTLLQSVVVVEQVDQQVPEDTGVVQMGLQEEIHREGADALNRQGCGLWETLRGSMGGG